jgi:hypothetical protein
LAKKYDAGELEAKEKAAEMLSPLIVEQGQRKEGERRREGGGRIRRGRGRFFLFG